MSETTYTLKPVAMKLDRAVAGSVTLPNSKEVLMYVTQHMLTDD